MSVLAHFEPLDQAPADRRGSPRLLLTLGSVLESCSSSVLIQDLSSTGLLFVTSADLASGDTIEVRLPEMGATRAKVVWRDGDLFGCQFEHPIPKAAVSAALLHSEPRRRRHDRAKFEQSLNDLPRAPTADRESDTRLHVPGKHLRITAVLVAALVLGGLVYLALTGGVTTLLVMAAVLSLLVSLLVLWGFWILNNTLDFRL